MTEKENIMFWLIKKEENKYIPKMVLYFDEFNLHHVLGESPRTSQSDHFMRKAHATN